MDTKFVITFLFIILIYKTCYKYDYFQITTTSVKADDGRYYIVRNIEENTQEAANILSRVIMTINSIVKYMCENDLPTSEISYRLQYRWKNTVVREIAAFEETAAYTVNKGEEMRLCIRKENGEFQEFNKLMFVVLHELGHMMSISYGHGYEFQDNFEAVIHIASSIGLYTPEDFEQNPYTYCGITVTSSPCYWGSKSCQIADSAVELEHDKPVDCASGN